MAGIELRGIGKRYGAAAALCPLDLSIRDGEFVVLAGPSGCGKTTLLRLIAGLTEPSSGSLAIGGREATGLPPGARGAAMVFQNYALFPHMTVERNLSFGLRLRRTPPAERVARVAEVARLLRMEELLGRFPRELSGGQKQRVALGRALIRRPGVFLFDEPLSNLDAALRVEMRAEILALRQAYPVTTLYVTHDQTEAMTLGERLIVMNEGRVMQDAPPLTVYQDPADAFTAAFIGTPAINLLQGRIEPSGYIFAAADGLRLTLPAGSVPAAARGREILLGFRPERCALADPGPGAAGSVAEIAADCIPGEVVLCEETGRERIVHLLRAAAEPAAEPVRLRCALPAPADPAPRIGARLGLRPLPGSLLCFDAASGARIR